MVSRDVPVDLALTLRLAARRALRLVAIGAGVSATLPSSLAAPLAFGGTLKATDLVDVGGAAIGLIVVDGAACVLRFLLLAGTGVAVATDWASRAST